MTNQPGGTAPAGFYPAENGRMRYWDGYQWTTLYRDNQSNVANSSASGSPSESAVPLSATSTGRAAQGAPASQSPFGPYWQADGTPRPQEGGQPTQPIAGATGAPAGPQDRPAVAGQPTLLLAPTATATLPENRNWFVRHKVLTGLIGVFALFMLMVILVSNGSSRTTVQSVASPVSASQTAPTPGADKAAADKAAADKAAADKAAAGTVSQQNAVRSARDYLQFQSFSRSGLIHQLEFEGFSTADATYGVDKLNVDWNEQAAKSAADYLKFSSFSHSGLVAQLKFDGFTAQQAEYGVKQTGL